MPTGSRSMQLRVAALPALNDFFAWAHLPGKRCAICLRAAAKRCAGLDRGRGAQVPRAAVRGRIHRAARIGDYTDFYTSIDHALNITRLFNPEGDVTPNFRWMPDGLPRARLDHRRERQRFHRPMGQTLAPGAKAPTYHACARLDYELELGVGSAKATRPASRFRWNARRNTSSASACSTTGRRATSSSGRWRRSGPFLAKNFATSISPWIVTMDALAPYRQACDAAGRRSAAAGLPGRARTARAARSTSARGVARKREGARWQERPLTPVAHQLPPPVLERGADGGAPHDGRLPAESGRPVRQRHDLGPGPQARPARSSS
jgi:2-keto-4-pentenoate hydratase/2-oxohepta-3-ene-1,7-dioic acid hydratase in catechol pathway